MSVIYNIPTESRGGSMITNRSSTTVMLDISKVMISDINIFTPYNDMHFGELMNSINEFGVLTPILVRELDGYFEILSGNNRYKAATEIGLNSIPAIVMRDISDDKALAIMAESNIVQRGFSDMSISERAFCIYQRYQLIQNDNKKVISQVTDITRDDNESTAKLLSDYFMMPQTNISRYLSINNIYEPLKKHVDSGRISFSAAIDISSLQLKHQEVISSIMSVSDCSIGPRRAAKLCELEQRAELKWHMINDVISGCM